MGGERGRPDERPVHLVELAGYRLGQVPVTRAQYAPFLEATGAESPPWWSHPDFCDPDQPVVGITWFEATRYAEWLTGLTGRRWRLPSEAEWERAARGGRDGAPTAWGESVPPGEIPEGRLDGPWPVGRGRANGFALLDIGTIVHEWCLDWYRRDYYASAPLRDPRGPASGQRRSSRGGSWRHHVRWSSPSARSSLPPGFRYSDYGFRVLEEMR
jgi:formylglycine-generating enzyme required for sulfatase activity